MEPQKQKKHPDFLIFLQIETEHQRQNGHLGIAKNYACATRSFTQFLALRGKQEVPLSALSRQLIADYEAWLQTRGLCKNTTSCYLRSLQAVYHKAVRQGLSDNRHPFLGTYRGVAHTVKRAISHEDIRHLQSLDIHAALLARGGKEGSRRLIKQERQLELARDIFLFCFCARGMTFVDVAHLRKTDLSQGIISYVRRKTHQRIIVQVEPMMQQIIRRHPSMTPYLFPLLTETDDAEHLFRQYHRAIGWYNTQLALIGQLIGGIHLTSYVSRHSWATAAYHQHIPLSVISQSMGHDSEKTTEIYLKSLKSNLIDKANHDLLETLFGKGGGKQRRYG